MSLPQPSPFTARCGAFEGGSDSPRHFLERCLEKLELWEKDVRAFTVTGIGGARAQADAATRRWRDGRSLSRIDGMPVGIKDVIDTFDMDTENGSPLYQGHRPLFDAASVAALRRAGTVVLGKTVTTEFAATEPGITRNPWDLGRTPGGSSSGSAAAVASGMVSGALGTQVVGSIIRPAAFCGVFGYKPSLGGINRGGSLDLLSQSCTGIVAATLEDAWAMAREISAQVGGDPGYSGIAGPPACPAAIRPRRVALLQTAGWDRMEPEMRAVLLAAVEALRSAGVEVAVSSPALDALEQILESALAQTLEINAWEWRWPLNEFMRAHPNGLSAATQTRFVRAMEMMPETYDAAIRRRAEARHRFAALADEFDMLITASAPGCAPAGLHSTGDPIFAVPASYLGAPALTLPKIEASQTPLGLQVIGFHGQDEALFAHAGAIYAPE